MSTQTETLSLLFDARQTDALLDDMAAHVALLVKGQPRPMLAGLLRRGVPIAKALQQRIGLPVVSIDVKRYSDDLTVLYPDTRVTTPQEDLDGACVVLVDDVLYMGDTALTVTHRLLTLSPARILLAVLVDRCCHRLPVAADVVGAQLQIAPSDIIECHVPPYESDLGIHVRHRP